MRIGYFSGAAGAQQSIEAIAEDVERAEVEGFASYSLANIFSHDAVAALGIAGLRTKRIELLTAVVPSYPRHPSALAQQALTTQAMCRGRFTLGIGVSHKIVIEDMLGMSFEKPARHMREYLSVLVPLLTEKSVRFRGEQYAVSLDLDVPDAAAVPCLVAAMGPVMLKLTGALADGTSLWMTGPKTVETRIAPPLRASAAEAGRAEPRLVAGVPVLLSDDVDAGRSLAAKQFEVYGTLPSYRGMLDHEGHAGPGDTALIGSEKEIEAGMRAYADAGATDLNVVTFGSVAQQVRTRACVADLTPEL